MQYAYWSARPAAAMIKIGQVVLSDSLTPMVTFDNIPQIYKILSCYIRSGSTSSGGVPDPVNVYFNADRVAANYSTSLIVTVTARGTVTSTLTADSVPFTAAVDSATLYDSGELTIQGYADPASTKIGLGQASSTLADLSAIELIEPLLLWNSVARITRIDFSLISAANFTAGSTFILYGTL